MKSFEDQNKELVEFDKTFDADSCISCVDRTMLLLRNREAQTIEDGLDWNYDTNSCRWAIEQNIVNRASGQSMMAAAIEYVESVEKSVENFNDIQA